MIENTPGADDDAGQAHRGLAVAQGGVRRDDKPKGGAGSDGDPGGGGLDPFGYEQLLCAEDIQQLEHFKAI
jgi:hypothetical protein